MSALGAGPGGAARDIGGAAGTDACRAWAQGCRWCPPRAIAGTGLPLTSCVRWWQVNYAGIIENGLLVVIALAFLGLLTGGFVKDNRVRLALLLGIGVIGVVIYMLTVNGGGGEPVI